MPTKPLLEKQQHMPELQRLDSRPSSSSSFGTWQQGVLGCGPVATSLAGHTVGTTTTIMTGRQARMTVAGPMPARLLLQARVAQRVLLPLQTVQQLLLRQALLPTELPLRQLELAAGASGMLQTCT